MDPYNRKTNEVDITITAPSDNEKNGESTSDEEVYNSDFEAEAIQASEQWGSRQDHDKNSDEQSDKNDENISKDDLCERFDSGVSLNDENGSPEAQKSVEKSEKGGQNYEIVGDRVLVERDGKFELVDANEIKAEYFEMLGIKPEGSPSSAESTNPVDNNNADRKGFEKNIRERPKTTPAFGSRGKDKVPNPPKKRVQSSWGHRSNEYSKIKSPYGLSEKQLEIKKKREEAVARRKKEEEERRKEEERQKREDAERAFQAWLNSKQEEEKERRKMAAKENTTEDKSRAIESNKAFKAWKAAKKKQEQSERQAATQRMQETASMYVVHDRGTCEEAFKRWLKKKKIEKKTKELEKKKRLRPKSRRKPKEPLPINSDKIRFTDNYGYRNTVVY